MTKSVPGILRVETIIVMPTLDTVGIHLLIAVLVLVRDFLGNKFTFKFN